MMVVITPDGGVASTFPPYTAAPARATMNAHFNFRGMDFNLLLRSRERLLVPSAVWTN